MRGRIMLLSRLCNTHMRWRGRKCIHSYHPFRSSLDGTGDISPSHRLNGDTQANKTTTYSWVVIMTLRRRRLLQNVGQRGQSDVRPSLGNLKVTCDACLQLLGGVLSHSYNNTSPTSSCPFITLEKDKLGHVVPGPLNQVPGTRRRVRLRSILLTSIEHFNVM